MKTYIIREYDFLEEHEEVINTLRNCITFEREVTIDYVEDDGVKYVRLIYKAKDTTLK